jgi:hypothetical protein
VADMGYIYQPPLTSADLNRLLTDIERSKKTLFCAPDMYERVRDAVYGGGYGICYRVVECRWLEDGQVILGPSEAEALDVTLPPLPFRW